MDDKVKVLLQIEIPRLNEDVDIASIRKILNEYVKSLIPRINIQDLKDWSLLIWVACRSTNGIGVFKRAKRYPSEVSYGLSKVKEAFYTPLSDKSFYSLEFNFEDYNSLYEYILDSSKHAIDLAFIKGITCNGKKIKFQK